MDDLSLDVHIVNIQMQSIYKKAGIYLCNIWSEEYFSYAILCLLNKLFSLRGVSVIELQIKIDITA